MFDRLKNVVTRYDDLTQQMADPAVLGDMARLQQVAREQRELEAVVTAYQRYERLTQQLGEAQQLLNDSDDADLRAMAVYLQTETQNHVPAKPTSANTQNAQNAQKAHNVRD